MKDRRDIRPESHELTTAITPLERVGTADGWEARRKLVLRNCVHTNLTALIAQARDTSISTSLAVFKPACVVGFEMEGIPYGGSYGYVPDRPAEPMPYRFYYIFLDDAGRRSRLQVLDWEAYQLCRKIMRKHGDDATLVYKHMRQKLYDELALERDLHFFLGTTRHWHLRRGKNPFTIVGLFYPPKCGAVAKECDA